MLNKFSNFYRKYRTIILVSILAFFALQVVNVFVQKKILAPSVSTQAQVSNLSKNHIPTLPQAIEPEVDGNEPEQPNSWLMWLPVIFITGFATLIYLFQNWKGIDKLFPGYVLMRAGIVGNRKSGVLKWQISLSNRKNTALVFSEPIIVFSNFRTQKRYKLNSTDYSRPFPISIEKKSRYQLTIELNQFYIRFPELVKYRLVRTEVSASNGKVYKSFWKVIAVRMG